MKQMKNIGIAAMALFLAGCDEVKFNGSMNVLEQMTFSQGQDKTVVVAPGQFGAKVTLGQSGGKKKIKLEIKNADPATTVKLEFDKNINIGGTFNVTASQLGQNFDLAGTMATQVEKSPEYSTYEGCTYQYPQTVCRGGAKSASEAAAGETLAADASGFAAVEAVETPEASNPELVGDLRHGPYPGNVAPPHTPVCHTVWVSRPGQRYVRYYIETTHRDIDAGFVQNGKTLGSFKGHSSQNETVYTYQSDCR
ncbi:MAG: hypothetical protein HY550_05240 [Elusimicrobia bacterium]|nr:hypothetical protein [Elusimicrobiota bacterium]